MKDIVAIVGLILLTGGCWIERPSLALIVSGILVTLDSIGDPSIGNGHYRGRRRGRRFTTHGVNE